MPGYRDDAYLKSITIEPTQERRLGSRPDEVRTIECAYDAEQVKGLTLKTTEYVRRLVLSRPPERRHDRNSIAESAVPRPRGRRCGNGQRYPSRSKQQPNGREAVARANVPADNQILSVCRKAALCWCPMRRKDIRSKPCLPVLIPVWAFSLVLALFCAAVLSGAPAARLAQTGACRAGTP